MYKKITLAIIGLLSFALFLSLTLSPIEDTQIYSEALGRLVTKDDTYNGELKPKKVYISVSVFDYSESRWRKVDKSNKIPADIQKALSQKAKLSGIELFWIDSPDVLEYNEVGEAKGGDAVLIFNKIKKSYFVSEVEAAIHVAYMASGSTIYRFYRSPLGWRFWSSRRGWIT